MFDLAASAFSELTSFWKDLSELVRDDLDRRILTWARWTVDDDGGERVCVCTGGVRCLVSSDIEKWGRIIINGKVVGHEGI